MNEKMLKQHQLQFNMTINYKFIAYNKINNKKQLIKYLNKKIINSF